MNRPDVENLNDAFDKFINETAPLWNSIRDVTWKSREGYLPIIERAVIVRQIDSLGAISSLVRASQGHSAVALLRPACEEMIWVAYLSKLSRTEANELLAIMLALEVSDALLAQSEYAGDIAMAQLGLDRHLLYWKSKVDELKGRLSELGKKLGWDKSAIKRKRLPSIKFLAKQTGLERDYSFLYQATSRFVHFSAAELTRRSWTQGAGKISIRSVHLVDYWSSFALCWGIRIFLKVLEPLMHLIPEASSIDGDRIMAAAEAIAKFGAVPIITAEELAWPELPFGQSRGLFSSSR